MPEHSGAKQWAPRGSVSITYRFHTDYLSGASFPWNPPQHTPNRNNKASQKGTVDQYFCSSAKWHSVASVIDVENNNYILFKNELVLNGHLMKLNFYKWGYLTLARMVIMAEFDIRAHTWGNWISPLKINLIALVLSFCTSKLIYWFTF